MYVYNAIMYSWLSYMNNYYVFQKLGNGLGAAGRVQINVHLEELGSVADKNVKDPNEGNMTVH